ncbi:MAG: hypothetical protein F6K00_29630 [Leptolyngbya sp. SIOISBB]|nr:hypothetical protein [Leptolyngbya sp. SIOISBB]
MRFISWLRRTLLLGLTLVTVLWLQPPPMQAILNPSDDWIPTTAMTWDEQYVRLPDWSQLTFGNLPPLMSDGSFDAPEDIIQSLGYDLSRQWTAGQSLETVLKLGDFQTSLYLQLFNLENIAELTQLDLNQIALEALDLADWQTIEDLVNAIPTLGNLFVDQVPPVAALVDSVMPQTLQASVSDLTLSEIISQFPDLAQESLGQLGDQLSQFALTDIPGLSTAPLQAFRDWGNSTLVGVPGLSAVPFDQMPNPLSFTGAIGQIDIVFGPAETQRQQTVSGSYAKGFQVPCKQNCGHIELTGLPELQGKQWISGQFQSVEGGEGILAAANGGLEPTGRHPFGEAFKVVVWDVDESHGTVSTAMFFRMCQQGGWFAPDLGCTPYFIGPVPFLTYQETEFLLLGPLEQTSTPSTSLPLAAGVTSEHSAAASESSPAPFLDSVNTCQPASGQMTASALIEQIVPPEQKANFVGPFVCDGQGNCGRSLGRYRLMSYRPEVRALIESQPGGAEFLARVDAGEAIADEELPSFLPLAAQQHQLQLDLNSLVQQAQQEGLTGQALLERVNQLYWGGTGIPNEAIVADIHGKARSLASEPLSPCLSPLDFSADRPAEEADR